MSPGPEIRIGDAERDAATKALGEHFATGRLTKEEYDERSDVALRARTGSELRALFVDLPSAPGRPAAARGRPRTAWPPPWSAVPLVPLLVTLAVLAAVSSGAWWLLFIFGWFFCCGPRRHWGWR